MDLSSPDPPHVLPDPPTEPQQLAQPHAVTSAASSTAAEDVYSPLPARLPPAPVPRSALSPSNPLSSELGQRLNPPSRASSPRAAPKIPNTMMMPQGMPAGDSDAMQMMGPAIPRSPDSNRPLNVTDALSYLDAVKMQFQDKPDVYNHFLDIMKDFKSQVIDTPGVIERVSMLFHGNPYLIQGFNTFLPPGYRIELSTDPRNVDTITVTTPLGIMTQNILGAPPRIPRDPSLPTSGVITPFVQQSSLGLPPPPLLPIGIGSGSRPVTPMQHRPAHAPSLFESVFSNSPAMQGAQTTAAASFLGNLGNRTMEKTNEMDFNHAIQYLNKIKTRFADDPETYKQFLEILQTYQKEQKPLHETPVYAHVQMLFKDAPDLMDEFKDFLPASMAPAGEHAGWVEIQPHPIGGPIPFVPDEAQAPAPEKATKAPNRRRKRAPEKEAAGTQKTTGGRVAKRAKPNHKPEPSSPKFNSFQAPPSPPPVHPHQYQAPSQLPPTTHTHALQPANITPNVNGASSTSEELLFFDRTKKALESGGTYDEFLKLLNLFAKDIIDTKTLIDRAEIFLGDGELMVQFKELMGWDDKVGNIEYGPPGSIRTGPPDPYAARAPDDGQGPSYRRLPESEIRLACSGRRQLERSVLNDEWVSHPTWASEESGFIAHKKNSFEEALHRSEEERHEYHVHLEALSRTIAVLEPLDVRLEEMSPEERTQFRLKPNLGGTSRTIYERIIKKVYGRDAGLEVLKALQECPSVAVPVVVSRLKQKYEEWRRSKREWSRTWREVDNKNFYKAFDHQGIVFKANDKKSITAKHLVQEIEAVKAKQQKAREVKGQDSFTRGSLGHQLEYAFQDTTVLHDSLKMIFSFLDHSPTQYSPPERRSIERFLRSFIPVLFMFPSHEFNAACGPLEAGHEDDMAEDTFEGLDGVADDGPKASRDRNGKRQPSRGQSAGVSAGDLRKRLLKTVQERLPGNRPSDPSSRSAALTRSASPAPSESSSTTRLKSSRLNQELGGYNEERSNPEDIWIREAIPGSMSTGETPTTRRPFYANTTFYTLLRLLQLLYSRLLMCKEIGAQLAAQRHAPLLANPVAVQLGLDEPNGPSVILAQAVEAVGESRTGETPNVLYMYLLDACEKVFDNELDQATFEEQMRWFFGTKAYHVFTLDRVITAIVKQVQTIMADNKCQELLYLLQTARGKETIMVHDTIRYRREAERHVGADDHLYRFDWDTHSRSLRVQWVDPADPSVEERSLTIGRWHEYVATYVMVHPTEWLPARSQSGALFLRRCLMDATEKGDVVETDCSMRVVVSQRTYKLMYEAGKEDVLWRRRGAEDDATLQGRAAMRQEERKRALARYS
ncbi:hypothetical protein AcW2_000258 [Taiwanofungus camphoratus]|nr:hypothetical protein AcW2_000258 [Antrodia cinnamomea]